VRGELETSLRDAAGAVIERRRLAWRTEPSAADLLGALTRLALLARRRGLVLHIDATPIPLAELVAACGLTEEVRAR
jgi:hypothetical protein